MSEPIFEDSNFLNHCGHYIDKDVKFCPECGAEQGSMQDVVKKLKEENESLKQTIRKLKNSGNDPILKRLLEFRDNISNYKSETIRGFIQGLVNTKQLTLDDELKELLTYNQLIVNKRGGELLEYVYVKYINEWHGE
jgi:hypothetical protein